MAGVLARSGYPEIDFPGSSTRPGIATGRNPAEGYQRAAGLEFGDVGLQVDRHPLFLEARAAAVGRSVMSIERLRNMFLLITSYIDRLTSQNIVEFGSYKGGSLLFFGILLKKLYPKAKVYGFDTFEGMPDPDSSVDLHYRGEFADTSMNEIDGAAKKLGLDNITLVKGMVQDTVPAKLAPEDRFGIAHIDLDLLEPIRHVQDVIWDRMVPGGYVVYDDATVSTCLGATQAVEELVAARRIHSEQIYPHFVFRAGLQNA